MKSHGPFNRTSMELKRQYVFGSQNISKPFNRTSMELKLISAFDLTSGGDILLIEPVWN